MLVDSIPGCRFPRMNFAIMFISGILLILCAVSNVRATDVPPDSESFFGNIARHSLQTNSKKINAKGKIESLQARKIDNLRNVTVPSLLTEAEPIYFRGLTKSQNLTRAQVHRLVMKMPEEDKTDIMKLISAYEKLKNFLPEKDKVKILTNIMEVMSKSLKETEEVKPKYTEPHNQKMFLDGKNSKEENERGKSSKISGIQTKITSSFSHGSYSMAVKTKEKNSVLLTGRNFNAASMNSTPKKITIKQKNPTQYIGVIYNDSSTSTNSGKNFSTVQKGKIIQGNMYEPKENSRIYEGKKKQKPTMLYPLILDSQYKDPRLGDFVKYAKESDKKYSTLPLTQKGKVGDVKCTKYEKPSSKNKKRSVHFQSLATNLLESNSASELSRPLTVKKRKTSDTSGFDGIGDLEDDNPLHGISEIMSFVRSSPKQSKSRKNRARSRGKKYHVYGKSVSKTVNIYPSKEKGKMTYTVSKVHHFNKPEVLFDISKLLSSVESTIAENNEFLFQQYKKSFPVKRSIQTPPDGGRIKKKTTQNLNNSNMKDKTLLFPGVKNLNIERKPGKPYGKQPTKIHWMLPSSPHTTTQYNKRKQIKSKPKPINIYFSIKSNNAYDRPGKETQNLLKEKSMAAKKKLVEKQKSVLSMPENHHRLARKIPTFQRIHQELNFQNSNSLLEGTNPSATISRVANDWEYEVNSEKLRNQREPRIRNISRQYFKRLTKTNIPNNYRVSKLLGERQKHTVQNSKMLIKTSEMDKKNNKSRVNGKEKSLEKEKLDKKVERKGDSAELLKRSKRKEEQEESLPKPFTESEKA